MGNAAALKSSIFGRGRDACLSSADFVLVPDTESRLLFLEAGRLTRSAGEVGEKAVRWSGGSDCCLVRPGRRIAVVEGLGNRFPIRGTCAAD